MSENPKCFYHKKFNAKKTEITHEEQRIT